MLYKVTGVTELLFLESEYPQCLWILDLLGCKTVQNPFWKLFAIFTSEECIFENDNFNKLSFCYDLSSEIYQFCRIKNFDFLDSLWVWSSAMCCRADRLGSGWFSCVTRTSLSDLIHQFWLEQSKLQFKLSYPFT